MSPRRTDRLTPRQREIVRLILAGHSDRVIAAVLFISIHTVDRHIQAIYKRLSVNNRAALVLLAMRKGIDAL